MYLQISNSIKTKKTINKMLEYDLTKESGFVPPTDFVCPICEEEIDASLAFEHVMDCFGDSNSGRMRKNIKNSSEKNKNLITFDVLEKPYFILEFVIYFFLVFDVSLFYYLCIY